MSWKVPVREGENSEALTTRKRGSTQTQWRTPSSQSEGRPARVVTTGLRVEKWDGVTGHQGPTHSGRTPMLWNVDTTTTVRAERGRGSERRDTHRHVTVQVPKVYIVNGVLSVRKSFLSSSLMVQQWTFVTCRHGSPLLRLSHHPTFYKTSTVPLPRTYGRTKHCGRVKVPHLQGWYWQKFEGCTVVTYTVTLLYVFNPRGFEVVWCSWVEGK